MRIKVLGSAAGGGFPQWNCQCSNCSARRRGGIKARPRTQTQVIFSPDSRVWFLLCASPDLRQQVLSAHELAPPPNNSSPPPIGGIFLPNADVDSVMGLLHLREFQSFFVFATRGVQWVLQKENRIFRVLERCNPPVKWQAPFARQRLPFHRRVASQRASAAEQRALGVPPVRRFFRAIGLHLTGGTPSAL